MEIVVSKDLLKANDTIAAANRARLSALNLNMINLLGSPGSGKTTVLEALGKVWQGSKRIGVIEGDLATSRDGERIEAIGWPATQINTGGGCHLEANMVANALESLPLDDLNLLVVENVGNLVCTASHDLGEKLRIVVLSVTEGHDKVAKYPPMFQKADVVVFNKADILEYTDFSIEQATEDALRLNPELTFFTVSARTGAGINELADFLLAQLT
ncbi:hydrogenase nickel incorporation protein HypB [bacterium]|nr:hydrogenase nickel incorporation protein HypB [bacterium]